MCHADEHVLLFATDPGSTPDPWASATHQTAFIKDHKHLWCFFLKKKTTIFISSPRCDLKIDRRSVTLPCLLLSFFLHFLLLQPPFGEPLSHPQWLPWELRFSFHVPQLRTCPLFPLLVCSLQSSQSLAGGARPVPRSSHHPSLPPSLSCTSHCFRAAAAWHWMALRVSLYLSSVMHVIFQDYSYTHSCMCTFRSTSQKVSHC